MNIKQKEQFIISILIPLAVGMLSALLSRNIMTTYSSLAKPPLSPPSFVFPIVWTILYILMGISSYLIYISNSELSTKALKIYAIQLVFNFFWSIIFFRFDMYLLAFLWLLIMIFLIIWMILIFFKINKTAGILQIPYLIWCLFAAYLNYMIFIYSLA